MDSYNNLILLYTIMCLTRAVPPITPHNIVYRIDSRNMAQIHEVKGMWPRVEEGIPDDDITHHFEGESVEGRVSNFVSTAYSLRQAVKLAAFRAWMNDEEGVDPQYHTYIYMIRPDHTFFDLAASLYAIRDREPVGTPQRQRLDALINNYLGMDEVIARGGFSEKRIIAYAPLSAGVLQRQYFSNQDHNSTIFNQEYWSSRWIRNVYYDDSFDTDISNSNVFIQSVNPRGVMTEAINGSQPTITLGLSCLGVAHGHGMKHKYDYMTTISDVCSSHEHIKLRKTIYDENLRRTIAAD